jgi:hypothetical protein
MPLTDVAIRAAKPRESPIAFPILVVCNSK